MHFLSMCSSNQLLVSHYTACNFCFFYFLFGSIIFFFFCCCPAAAAARFCSYAVQCFKSLDTGFNEFESIFFCSFCFCRCCCCCFFTFSIAFLIIIQSIAKIKTHNGQSRRNNMEQTVINQQALI